jgi:putative membrane protein (TIGR04086 family)
VGLPTLCSIFLIAEYYLTKGKGRWGMKNKERPLYSGIIMGIIVGVLSTLLLCAVSATLVNSENINENRIGLLALSTVTVSTFAGSLIAGKCVSTRIAVACILTAVIIGVLLAAVCITAFDANFSGVFPIVCAMIVGSVCGCVGCVKKYKPKRKHLR